MVYGEPQDDQGLEVNWRHTGLEVPVEAYVILVARPNTCLGDWRHVSTGTGPFSPAKTSSLHFGHCTKSLSSFARLLLPISIRAAGSQLGEERL